MTENSPSSVYGHELARKVECLLSRRKGADGDWKEEVKCGANRKEMEKGKTSSREMNVFFPFSLPRWFQELPMTIIILEYHPRGSVPGLLLQGQKVTNKKPWV